VKPVAYLIDIDTVNDTSVNSARRSCFLYWRVSARNR